VTRSCVGAFKRHCSKCCGSRAPLSLSFPMSSIDPIVQVGPAGGLTAVEEQASLVANRTVAFVVIGRNEGERLQICLRSVLKNAGPLVYVDSGSVDGSCELAESLGVPVRPLDPSRPFSAARARNEGFAWIMKHAPATTFVQFLDGDCELEDGWLAQGMAALNQRQDVAIVCGHVHEQYPKATIYNRLCELEWHVEPGEIRSSGGRFIVRAQVFRTVQGFRADVIAAEDDEFCLRVRRLGWKILQVDAQMAYHDAAMTRFAAWWRRARRSGHAYAQGAALHGRSADRHFVRDCVRILVWGLAVPLAALAFAVPTRGLSLILLLAYPLQAIRIFNTGRRRGWSTGDASIYAVFTVVSKFPALVGLFEYLWKSSKGTALTIIEYKRSSLQR
jgi:GT2 family glycosyltransferase